MRIVIFAHSFLSDWNHGNAHFLRGVVTELVGRGHDVGCFEPRDAWSIENLVRDHGVAPIAAAGNVYPALDVTRYTLETLDLDVVLDDADLVIVHEWNDPALVAAVGEYRRTRARLRALFHDTHHRSVSAPHELERYDLTNYDGVLAFGEAVSEVYRRRSLAERVWTWHEAADVRIFRPLAPQTATATASKRDLVWIGNWGDEERSSALREFLVEPVRSLGLDAEVHGVRYPDAAILELGHADIAYRGWLANYEVPQVFARFGVTVHVPRGPYVRELSGVPTIRVFEALACGIPLVCAPWDDVEGLFRPGTDYLVARDGHAMTRGLRDVLADADVAHALADEGRKTILARHTCAHRVDELLAIAREISPSTASNVFYDDEAPSLELMS